MKAKIILCAIGVLILVNSAFTQGDPSEPVYSQVLSPAIQWESEFFPEIDLFGNPQEKDDTGEEWLYEPIETKVNGVVTGYAVAGFVGDRAFESFTIRDDDDQVVSCMGFDNWDLIDCEFFWTNGNRTGLKRQVIVWYDLNGNITNYKRYNLGEAWCIAQDDDGFLYIGGDIGNVAPMTNSDELSGLTSENHLSNVPIYYNPTTQNPTQTFDPSNGYDADCSAQPYRYKFSVTKIAPNGNVVWNNIYGLEDDLHEAFSTRGIAHTLIVDGDQVLVGGYSGVSPGSTPGGVRKFLVSVNKNTGNYNWKLDFNPATQGRIRQIINDGGNILISGTDYDFLAVEEFQGFVALCSDQSDLISSAAFVAPEFYNRANDIPSSISSGHFDESLPSASTSAIFADGNIYWFLLAENQTPGGQSGIGEGVVLELDDNGNYTDVDNFGEIRAFDLFLSGTPTEGGGFALVTSRHTTQYFNTGLLPTFSDPLSPNDPSGPTLGDCLYQISTECDAFDTPNSNFYKFLSTCTYIRKYGPGLEFQWDKIWDSERLAPRECFPKNLKQQECMYRIIQSSTDGGLLVCGNTSDNYDDGYVVKLHNDCSLEPFFGEPNDPDLIVDFNVENGVSGADPVDGVYEIEGTIVWNTPKMVLGRVAIKSGATLTILNTEVQFASNSNIGSGIDVEQNGALIVDNSTLTAINSCNDMWNGINVWGTSDEHQYVFNGNQYHQGRATFQNNAIVEHANTALRNWQPENYNAIGGIIRATNTTFRNNRRSAEFRIYQNKAPVMPFGPRADRSYFRTCDFTVDDNIPVDLSDNPMIPAITMWKTDRIQIEGCNFINESTVQHSEERSAAIFSHDASYLIREKCTTGEYVPCQPEDIIANTFSGWHRGIEALETVGGRPILVRNSMFEKNMIGVRLQGGIDGSVIYWNDFMLGNHPYDYENQQEMTELSNLGVHTTETHIFSIEDNTFERAQDASEDAHGVLINNTLGYDNQIHKNEFTDLKVAANSWQLNRNANAFKNIPAGGIGLQFLCNQNSGNERDFIISRIDNGLPDFFSSGMRNNQGNLTPPLGANNEFSTPNPDPNILTHWTVNTNQNVFHRYNYLSNAPNSSEVSPLINLSVVSEDNLCETNYPTEPTNEIDYEYGKMIGAITEFEGIQYTYSAYIDNGNTPGMLNDIALTWPNDAWALRDELMLRSPYNSEAVLISAAEREIMPHAMLLEVLLANPDALRSGHVIQFVEFGLINPLPSYMISMLHLAQSETTVRTALEDAMSYWHAEASKFQKRALAAKQFSTEETTEPDSTVIILSKVKTPVSDLARANVYARTDNYSAAINLIDSINLTYKLLENQHQDLTNLKGLYLFLDQIHTQGTELPDMSEGEIAIMKGFAEDPTGGIAAQKAQGALCFHHNICYTSSGVPKSNGDGKSGKPYPTESEILAKFNTSKAYPNPAVEHTTIQYNLLHAIENTELRVYDALGRSVQAYPVNKTYEGQIVIDTRTHSNGVYIYEIVQEGERVLSGKFIVNH